MSRKPESRPILVNGEHYVQATKKKSGFGNALFPRSYDEARELLNTEIAKTENAVSALPANKKLSEVVYCLRLHEKFIAKSHNPSKFISESDVKQVGSRKWIKSEKANITSKLIFVKAEPGSLKRIKEKLDAKESSHSKDWINDVRKIDSISLLNESEQLLGFNNWQDGAVEIVLHPMGDLIDEAIKLLTAQLKKVGVPEKKIKISTYPGGLAFLCAELKKKDLEILKGFNPLRTAHPLKFEGLPKLRGTLMPDAPQLAQTNQQSRVKVGVFDGGIDPDIPLLKGFAKNYDVVPSAAHPDCIEHGSAVAGVILHGQLNPYGKSALLPPPPVTVESFRSLPLKDPTDINLYEVIDKIEEIVPQRNDIKVYNLSLGPRGPILDDEISRFTFAVDSLAYQHKVLFVVACGNDGDEQHPLNRVQSPSDAINALAVGASSYQTHKSKLVHVRADYSCVGPGREGSKMKPDLVAFGGCSNHPFHLVSTSHGKRLAAHGTSFSAPLVSRLAAETMGRSDRIGALMAKVLMMHTSQSPNGVPDHEFGFGLIPENAEEMLSCSEKRVTVLFQGSMRSGTYAKLPIPFINCEDKIGSYKLQWTIGISTKPDSLNPEEYSSTCIEDTFYPHSHIYSFSNPKSKKREYKILDVRHDTDATKELTAKGWKKAQFPKTASGNIHKKSEKNLRQQDLKWDTVVKREKGGRLSKVCDPFLVLHAMGRNEHEPDMDPLHYAVAATIDVSSYRGDLYNDILNRFNALTPIEVRAVNELFVRT